MTQIQTSKTLEFPTEIISEIIKNFSTPVPIHQGPKSFPWFLGHICARWRIVFLSMSTHFWGNIKIDFSRTMMQLPLSVAYFERALDILNFCLKCNEGCPLSFSFDMGDLHTEEHSYVTDVLDALLAQSMRWKQADLHLEAAEVARLHRIKGRIPLLQSLLFEQREQFDNWKEISMPIDPGFARFVNAFENSPSLTHLELYTPNPKGWKCDWSSIVVLRLKSLSLSSTDGLVAVLSQSMRLEELQVTGQRVYTDSPSGPIDASWSMITLSSLKKMTLPWNVFDVLGVLTAPGLEDLSIEFNNSDKRTGTVGAFLRRSSCPLGHLVLQYASPAVAVEVLSAIPGLPSLEIHQHFNNNAVNGIIKLFNCNLSEGALLIGPRLKSLQFHLMGGLQQGVVVELSTMVASRAQNVKVDGLQELTPGQITVL
jgi:hypothetical protein